MRFWLYGFKNNENLAVVTAAFIDSGSLLGDYLKLVERGKFDQAFMYHTSIYGWPGNSLSIWVLWLAENTSFATKAAIARSLSFIMSILSLVCLGVLLTRINANKVMSVVILLFVALWAPFVVFHTKFILKHSVCFLAASRSSHALTTSTRIDIGHC
ncbi:hypothetical protein HED55_04235 [Ochrobactrum haematophilum]|uniref:Uncharacterized protein n=1 Tax=Brucella haematophila TaxID=419474 RepID=A0ABX1DMM2_9HYPH|nr:hypothetical protein [Brucella haematophila]